MGLSLFKVIRYFNTNRIVEKKYVPHDDYMSIAEKLTNYLNGDIVIVCIGTNRTDIIDCWGPFVGSLLKEDKEFNVPVYGTMVSPIHAGNLFIKFAEIKNKYPNSTIIAVDACLADQRRIGHISINKKPLRPGAGVDKNLGEIGEISIQAFVAPLGINIIEYGSDLNFILEMARITARGIKESFKIYNSRLK